MLAQRLRTATSPLLRSSGARLASTAVPKAPLNKHYTPREWAKKYIPTEAYPLICAVIAMSTYGITKGVMAFNAVPGELRLVPERLAVKSTVEPWEDNYLPTARSGHFA